MRQITVWLFSIVLTFASYAARAAGDTKAAELLAQARAAIGGDRQVAKVHGLSAEGTVQRMIGDRQVSGEVTIDLQLPDKMLRTDSISPMGDKALVVTGQGINGDKLLHRSRMLNLPPGAVVRTPPPPAPGSDAEAQGLRSARADLARLTVALLLAAPPSVPLDFTYAGEAESPDGKADVIDVRGAGNFAARLFLDKNNHRPLMLSYRGVAPRVVVQQKRAGGPPPAGRGERGDVRAEPPPPEVVDIDMFFDGYKSVDGVLLPHHITRSIDGKPSEDITFNVIKVNPSFKPDTFSGQ